MYIVGVADEASKCAYRARVCVLNSQVCILDLASHSLLVQERCLLMMTHRYINESRNQSRVFAGREWSSLGGDLQ